MTDITAEVTLELYDNDEHDMVSRLLESLSPELDEVGIDPSRYRIYSMEVGSDGYCALQLEAE